jgi:arylformamidase
MAIDPRLDALYNNRAAVPEHPAIFERWRRQSDATRASLACELNLAYGTDPLQTLDLFPAAANRGLAVFIHGGYWRSLDKGDFSFVAEPLVARGISTAMINYRLCPQVAIADIVADCAEAVTWLADHAADYRISIDRTALIGHSAGGHLVAMLYATDWTARGVHPEIFRGGVAVSGLYDLAPMLDISVNDDLRLEREDVAALSPAALKPLLDVPLDIIVGSAETAEFIRQSTLIGPAWPTVASTLTHVPQCNHFTIVDHYVDPASAAFQQTLRFFD